MVKDSPFHRFFYLHIPKTAGRYMWGLISKNFEKTDALFWSDKNERRMPMSIRQHLSKDAFCGHSYYEFKELFPNDGPLFVFTMLREPSERLYSQYMHLTIARPDLNLSLRDFILGKGNTCPSDNVQSRMIGSKIKIDHAGDEVNAFAEHYLKRSIELENIDDILSAAIARIKTINCFGLVERIVDSGELLSSATGMNVCARQIWRIGRLDALSSNDRNMINSINGADRELYAEALLIFNSKVESHHHGSTESNSGRN